MNIILNNDKPKYIQIYEAISNQINTGVLKSNSKLPSKRTLSIDLNVSLSTVENAYFLLIDEGYIYTVEKRGYFVTDQDILAIKPKADSTIVQKENSYRYDFTTRSIIDFPISKWKKAIKDTIDANNFLSKTPLMGDYNLRCTIRDHLKANRGIITSADNILITTGLESLKDVLKLTKINTLYLENPGYHKLRDIVENMEINYQELDSDGVTIPSTRGILYTTPFSQFPTGIKMSISRKKELINWAIKTNSYIIEDDFDAEFRINSNPTTSLYSLLPEKVIFFSTFSTTLFPGIRLSYVIIPSSLNYKESYKGLSNPVSTLIQLALNNYISTGSYTRLINSNKKKYIEKRNIIISYLDKYGIEYDSKKNYLSILIKVNCDTTSLVESLKDKGLLIDSLSSYDYNKKEANTLILGYTAIKNIDIEAGIKLIKDTAQQ